MSDPWAPPSAESRYEQAASPHEERMLDVMQAYSANCQTLVYHHDEQRSSALRHMRVARTAEIDPNPAYLRYCSYLDGLPALVTQRISEAADSIGGLLAQHGPDLSLWSRVSNEAVANHAVPFHLLSYASSPLTAQAMRLALDGVVWSWACEQYNAGQQVQAPQHASSYESSALMTLGLGANYRETIVAEFENRTFAAKALRIVYELSPRVQNRVAGVALFAAFVGDYRGTPPVPQYPRPVPVQGPQWSVGSSRTAPEAQWLLAQLPLEMAAQVSGRLPELQQFINSVRNSRLRLYAKGLVLGDSYLYAQLRAATCVESPQINEQTRNAFWMMHTLMAGDPQGTLPF